MAGEPADGENFHHVHLCTKKKRQEVESGEGEIFSQQKEIKNISIIFN